jgi:hypothetical protein
MPVAERQDVRDEIAQHVITPELQQRLLRHKGRWVAITKSTLIAVGDSPSEVLGRAREQGESRPIIYLVPRDGNAIFIL